MKTIVAMLRPLVRIAHLSFLSLGLLVGIVIATPVATLYARLLAGGMHDPEGEILIVLAGADSEDGIMGDSTYLRCVYAVRAFRSGSFRRVIVSGGQAAHSMRDFLVYHGVPDGAVQVEARSQSTRESVLFVRDLLSGVAGRKVLLTSDYHMFRAKRAFLREGVEVAPRPFPDAIKRAQRLRGRMHSFVNEVMETGKIVYYRARGWI